jgi:glutaminase
VGSAAASLPLCLASWALALCSPLLDEKGNSVRGIKACEDLSRDFGLHLFNVAKAERDLYDWIESRDVPDGW